MAMLDTYLRLPPFHYSQGEEWFNFAHENIRNTLNITYVKIKKKITEPIFKRQPARASLNSGITFKASCKTVVWREGS